MKRTVSGERGAALAVTLILTTALLGAGALAIYLQVSDTRAAQALTQNRGALFCAESGLAVGRSYVGAHDLEWSAMLDATTSNDPAGYPITGDIDADGVDDFSVSIRDNDDELPPNTNNDAVDNDRTVIVVSTCTKYTDTERQVLEILSVTGGGTSYRNQLGQGGAGTNNGN